MAWGKGGSSNVVKVTTNSRRAFSVPAEDVSYLPLSRKTASTVDYTKEDISSLTSNSRKQDKRLLDDITTRLANAAFTQPAKRESRSRVRRRAPSAPASRRGSVSSLHSVPRKPSLADEEFEIVFPSSLKAGPLPPCVRRAQNRTTFQRSASLPPSPPSRGYYGIRSLIDTESPLLRLVDNGPKPIYQSAYAKAVDRKLNEPPPPAFAAPWIYAPPIGAPPKRRYSFAFEDPKVASDLYNLGYTPQYRTTSSYPITVPKPFVRPYTSLPRYPTIVAETYDPRPIARAFRAESEPRRDLYTPSSSLAIRQARASLSRIERELGMGSASLDDAPYLDEPIVTTTTVRPVRAVSRTGFIRGNASVPARRGGYQYGVVSSRPPPIPTKVTRRHEIEAKLDTLVPPEPIVYPQSISSLRSRTNEAKNQMDIHRTMLDRYLPIPSGPPGDVPYEVEYKFSELAERMPQLLPRERRDVDRATSLPPYRPIDNRSKGPAYNQYNDALRTRPFVPKVSDTRKRARDVLCRTKGDPHYFDY